MKNTAIKKIPINLVDLSFKVGSWVKFCEENGESKQTCYLVEKIFISEEEDVEKIMVKLKGLEKAFEAGDVYDPWADSAFLVLSFDFIGFQKPDLIRKVINSSIILTAIIIMIALIASVSLISISIMFVVFLMFVVGLGLSCRVNNSNSDSFDKTLLSLRTFLSGFRFMGVLGYLLSVLGVVIDIII